MLFLRAVVSVESLKRHCRQVRTTAPFWLQVIANYQDIAISYLRPVETIAAKPFFASANMICEAKSKNARGLEKYLAEALVFEVATFIAAK